ncbi:MAG: carboxypeptidase regulatory-like domain-containing protein [Fibrobacteria bacterium]|nr:carboxypeptidase regulatory-like domain-containing protein [Fibrobacteria bacterium]
MKRLHSLPALAASLWLASCGSDTSAGGGGFGGETISGRVVDGSGQPVAGAVVRARMPQSLDGKPSAQTSTNDSGRFTLEGLPSTFLRIEIAGRVDGDSVRALADRDPGRPTGDLVARSTTLHSIGIVDDQGRPVAATLQAYGLGTVASTDDSGIARLSGWPLSDLWARVTPRDGQAAFDLFVPASASADPGGSRSRLVAAPGWLIDDFEGTSTKTRLGLLIGGGWWYAASSGTNSDLAGKEIGHAVFGHGYDTTRAHGGNASLHVDFAFDPGTPDRYGLVGFHLGVVDGQTVDLSGMDSLEIWLKGNGPVRIDLVALEGGAKHVYARSVDPGADWTRFALVPTDFVPVDGGTEFPAASSQVLYLQFSVYQDTEFWLDDLRLFAKTLP